MSTQKQRSLSRFAQEIQGYLRQHRVSSQTVEEISGWWLLGQRQDRSTAEVKTALAELKQGGLVVISKRRDGRLRYRIAPRQIAIKGDGAK